MTAETKIENQIALIEAKDLVSFDREKADEFLKKLREQELSVIGDISTDKGRKELASRAHRIAKIKTAVDAQGAKVKEDAQKIVKAVDAERRRIWDDLESLQHEVRRPLTEWENADKDRIAEHEAKITEIEALRNQPDNQFPESLDSSLELLGNIAQRDWQEFANRATLAINQTRDALTALRARRVKEIADAAELERLRKEAEERARKDREAEIARQAAEVAAKAEQEKAAQAAAEAEAKHLAEVKAREDAEKAAQEAKERAERAEAEKIAAAEKAEQDRIAAAKKSEENRIAAEAEAKRREEAAAQAERDRQAAEAKRLADEQAAREADKAHRAKINNEILLALSEIHTGTQDEAKAIITAIALGKIPHVKITY